MKNLDPFVLWQVAVEFLGPWIWLFAALFALWLVALIAARGRGRSVSSGVIALWAGVAVAVIAAVILPWLTGSGWARLNGSADWIALALLALGIGVAAMVFLWPLCRWAFAPPARLR